VPRSLRLIVLAAAAVLFFGLPSFVRAYTDWLWFHEVQFPSVFAITWTTRLALGAIVFVTVWGWLYGNLRLALQSLRFTAPFVWTAQQGVQLELPGRRQLQRLAFCATALV
jgi:uncharacterized membrane protein (UPF0182 family)